jgi:nucleoside-diphosphate-sugar epimerase
MSGRPTALIVGGTGPTGPHVIQGLVDRGYEVTLFHRGVHEPPGLPDVEHLHGDPHFAETIEAALGGRRFDVVLALYGRVKEISRVMAGRCSHLVAVGGVTVYRGSIDAAVNRPYGMAVMATEASPLATSADHVPKLASLMIDAERSVLEQAGGGAFQGTVVRYPQIYGPRNVIPWEWSVVRRVLDGRPYMILPDGGLGMISRCAARNAAEVLLKVVDSPEVADGQAYNCADDEQATFRQWVEQIVDLLDGDLKVVGLPAELAEPTWRELIPIAGLAPHVSVDASKAARELGYVQVVSAQEALTETVSWLLANRIDPKEYPAHADRFDYAAEDRLISAYRAAMSEVRVAAGRPVPEVFHALPHPKKPSLTVDERGR